MRVCLEANVPGYVFNAIARPGLALCKGHYRSVVPS